jgi:hypothetical protein
MSMTSVLKDVHKDLLPADLNRRLREAYRKIADVVTLSKHPFEALREGSHSPGNFSDDSKPSSRATFSLSRRTSFTSYSGDNDIECDYAVVLNNFLQGHPTGNMTSLFHYVMTREGGDDAFIHIATAKCEHHYAE